MKLSLAVGIGFTLLAGSGTIAQQPSSELADGPGKDVVVRVCGECHEPASRISKFKKSESEWAEVITDMQNRGMMADDKEIEVVLAYLTKQYGKSPAPFSVSHRLAGRHAHQPEEMRRVRQLHVRLSDGRDLHRSGDQARHHQP
jgi:mono/diheme cytochrome c family protein